MNKLLLLFLSIVIISCSSLLGVKTKTDKPKSDLKTKVKRFEYDKEFDISELHVSILDDTLNLFKNNALIKIDLEGCYFRESLTAETYLKDVLFLEKVSHEYSQGLINHLIEIQLVLNSTKRKNRRDQTIYEVNGEKVCFSTKLEHRLYTHGFGRYRVVIKCGEKSQIIELFQGK